jgi:hypothetical protein
MMATATEIRTATLAYHPRGVEPDADFVALLDSQEGATLCDAVAWVVNGIVANASLGTEDGKAAADEQMLAIHYAIQGATGAVRRGLAAGAPADAVSIDHALGVALDLLPTAADAAECENSWAAMPVTYLLRASRDAVVATALDVAAKKDQYDVWAAICSAGVTVARAEFAASLPPAP